MYVNCRWQLITEEMFLMEKIRLQAATLGQKWEKLLPLFMTQNGNELQMNPLTDCGNDDEESEEVSAWMYMVSICIRSVINFHEEMLRIKLALYAAPGEERVVRYENYTLPKYGGKYCSFYCHQQKRVIKRRTRLQKRYSTYTV